jgi:IgA Peptidase M64
MPPPPRQEPITVERNGTPADSVDLLLIGDGYTSAECAAKFPADARRMADALFRHEPYAGRRSAFNVWGLCPPSAESGIARPSTGTHRRTPVGAAYDAFGSERYVLTFDNRALRDVAAWAPYEFITILANSQTYGGGGIYGTFATVAIDSDWADYLFVHEFGHHFAGLADEYYTSPVAYEPAERIVEPWEANVTALLDGRPLKWRDLVAEGTPLPTPWPKEAFEARQREFQARRKQIRAENRPESVMSALFREEQAQSTRLFAKAQHAGHVGAFRGANYDSRAYYRPQLDCVMFTRNEVPFCRVCQRALDAVIDLYAGPRITD